MLHSAKNYNVAREVTYYKNKHIIKKSIFLAVY